MQNLRIVFMGTGDIALPTFQALLDLHKKKLDLLGLVTQPDKPVGRKQILTPPKIKELALTQEIPVDQPESAKSSGFIQRLRQMKPDVIVVMAYGQILSQELLEIPTLAFVNVHASLLPRWRGAACIQAAIDAGDSHTGITIMHVVKKLDAGDLILKKATPIAADETGGVLHDRLADMAPAALLESLELLANGTATREPQIAEEVTYIGKLMRDDGEIDWNTDAESLERRIRAYDPWPGTFTHFTDQKGRKRRMKIFPGCKIVDESPSAPAGTISAGAGGVTVHCGTQALILGDVQPDGSRRMTAEEFWKGGQVKEGDLLG